LDTLTHALSGALLARATAPKDAPPRSLPRRMAAGFLACAAPDLDFVVGWFGPVAYLENHRGLTHSLVLLPLWALLLAWLLAKILREPRGWRALYAVTALSIGLHIAGDLITSYGTMIFAPLSDLRAGIGTTFIIDLWFTGIILAGLTGSAALYRSRAASVAAMGLLLGYVGFQFALKSQAIEFGSAFARAQGLRNASVTAEPRPVSPFNWSVFVSDERTQRFAHINLVRKAAKPYRPGDGFVARLDAPYLPREQAIWASRSRYGETGDDLIHEAWNSDGLRFFRWFASLPAFDGLTENPVCAWFVDLRFATPGREAVPFQFGACREAPNAPWRPYRRNPTSPPLLLR
jgi:inner membrane protein